MNKTALAIICSLVGLLVIALFFIKPRAAANVGIAPGSNVHMENGTQIIEIRAGGGYSPANSVAQAGIPTKIRFTTGGVFDCSASVRIPSLDIAQVLPQAGTQDIDIGIQKVGPLQGMCGMGMYPFSVTFQ